MDVLPILSDVLRGARLHGRGTFGPAGRANFSVLGVVLESLDQAEIFGNVTANSQIVDADVSQNLVVVNDEGAAKSESAIVQNSVIRCDLFLEVGNQRNVNASEATLAAGLLSPSSVNEVRVNGASEDFAPVFPEGFGMIAEIYDFSGADEGEVKRIEEKEYPFVLVVCEREFLELAGG